MSVFLASFDIAEISVGVRERLPARRLDDHSGISFTHLDRRSPVVSLRRPVEVLQKSGLAQFCGQRNGTLNTEGDETTGRLL